MQSRTARHGAPRSPIAPLHRGPQAMSASLYGAQTQRAVDNFKVSGRPMPARFLTALAHVKWASAKANEDLGLLEPRLAKAIRDAADEVIAGELDEDDQDDIVWYRAGDAPDYIWWFQ